MSSPYAIDAPHPLFTLPKPFDHTRGQTLAGVTCSVHGSRKRKRAEVVLGVDGESINVYDIKIPRLLTSHAIPPQAYLTARPCCAHTRSNPGPYTTRYTYAALQNQLAAAKHEVVCFREELAKSLSSPVPYTSVAIKSSVSLGSDDNVVIFVEPIIRVSQENDASPHELVVVQERGQIIGLSPDVSKENWRTSVQNLSTDVSTIPASKTEEVRIKHVFVQSAAVARRGILKGREDLIALFDPTGQSNDTVLEQTTILCLISVLSSTGEHQIHVLAARPSPLSSRRGAPIQSLVRWLLPSVEKENKSPRGDVDYMFDQASGTLFQLVDGSLITYGFSSLAPKILSRLQIPQQPIESFLPAPHSMAVVASKSNCSLYNMHYTSLQASVNINDASSLQVQSRKRKRTDSEKVDASVRLLEYFPRDNLIVGIVARDLVVFSMRLPAPERQRSSIKAGRLIDSLGRGIAPLDSKARIAPIAPDAEAISALATLDPSLELLSQRINEGEVMALSGAVEALKHLLRSFNTPKPKALPQTHLLTNGNNNLDPDSLESTFAAEDAALSADLALATSLLSPAALAARAAALKSAISLLGVSFPPRSVAQALRKHLERRDILFLIDLLRQDMERGGWTSRCLDVWPDDEEDNDDADPTAAPATSKPGKNSDAAIGVVCKVLNSALDALGMGAWVTPTHTSIDDAPDSGSDDEAEADTEQQQHRTHQEATSDTLTHLRAITEAALECVQESAFFTGFIGEFLRYEQAACVPKTSPTATTSSSSALITTSSSPYSAAITTATTTSAPDAVAVAEQGGGAAVAPESMLPLGVRSARGVSKTVVVAGGEVVRRSKRSVASELSRRVGVYAFERVRV